jgi:hypothetical protein
MAELDIIGSLRRRDQLLSESKRQSRLSDSYANSMGRPQFATVTGGAGGSIGGSSFQMPQQVNINWGDILGKGASNFLSARADKKASDLSSQADDIDRQFMESTLQNDPEAAKLYGLAQSGLPGADKALANHLSPKKEALAGYTQLVASGNASPELLEELATRYGIDPEVARRAGEYSIQRQQRKSEEGFGQKVLLNQMTNDSRERTALNRYVPNSGGYTVGELQNMSPEQRKQVTMASAGRESAETKERSKLKVAAEQGLPALTAGINRAKDLVKLASDPDLYLPGQFGLKPEWADGSGKVAMLKQALKQMTLDASGGSLGAQISNSDRDFLQQAQVNFDRGDYKTATAQLNAFLTNLIQKQEIAAKNAGFQAPNVDLSDTPRSPLDYTNTKQAQKKYGGRTADELFDEFMKEMGQ